MLLQEEEQSYEVEMKKVNYLSKLFFWSYIMYCLFNSKDTDYLLKKEKKKITPDHSLEFCGNSVHAKFRREWTNQSNGSIIDPLGLVFGRMNISASLHVYRLDKCYNVFTTFNSNKWNSGCSFQQSHLELLHFLVDVNW